MDISGTLTQSAYQLLHRLHSAVVRWKYRQSFDKVERFCLFVGYPRSGHSIVAAFLNAHKDAVISHELNIPPLVLGGCSRNDLYAQLIARAQWFDRRLKNKGCYNYQIPGQWQGRFGSLRVIGDKRGGAVSRCLLEHPDFLQQVRDLTGVPLRLVHVVRNPYDNIAAISLWHHLSLRESIDYYFRHCRAVLMLDELARPGEVFTVCHEEMIERPRQVLEALCAHLQLETYPGYLDDCTGIVFNQPTFTRRKVVWTDDSVQEIAQRAQAFPALQGYGFAIPA